jgi:transposase
MSPAEVAQLLGVHLSSVKRWKRAFQRDGVAGLAAKPHPGPRPKLSAEQQHELCDALVEGAQAAGYSTDLWTGRRVAQLIRERFGVTYHFNHVGRLLHDLGFSPQQPQRRASERDEEAIARWRREDWPRIKKRAAAGKLASCFSMKRAFSCGR